MQATNAFCSSQFHHFFTKRVNTFTMNIELLYNCHLPYGPPLNKHFSRSKHPISTQVCMLQSNLTSRSPTAFTYSYTETKQLQLSKSSSSSTGYVHVDPFTVAGVELLLLLPL